MRSTFQFAGGFAALLRPRRQAVEGVWAARAPGRLAGSGRAGDKAAMPRKHRKR